VFSVFDIDGARYDYDASWPTGSVNGVYTPRAGNHATLDFDGDCGFVWTKKSGTIYYFYRPSQNAPCIHSGSATGGFAGRIHQIIGRNRNTYVTFNYSWDNGDASATGKIGQISAQTESGLAATLSFADVNGHRLLQQITFPDGATTVQYGYDANGNLTTVSRPPNNAAGTRPLQGFAYSPLGSGFVLAVIGTPRWNGSDGGAYVNIAYAGSTVPSSTLSAIAHVGVMNPAVPDGVSSGGLQSGYTTGAMLYLYEWYQTGITTPTYRDSDGHYTNWVVDGLGRPTQTQECTATTAIWTCSGALLATNEGWDANNNLTSEMDPRGYQTDYGYDSNGNTVIVAAPATTVVTPNGTATFRPTQLFDYDVYNNLVAYCDQRASHPQGDWTASGPPTAGGPDAMCSTNGSSAHAVFTFPINPAPSYEPYGQLTNIRTALGYNHTISYDLAPQGGTDYGLPTSVHGDTINQPDGSRTPFQAFTYDAQGNLVCSMIDGADSSTTTVLAYDSLNRNVAIGDPDDASLTNASRTKSAGLAGSSIVNRKAYFADGTTATTQTPAEAAANVSTQFQYDLDGNVTSEVHNHTSTPATTRKWYDGADSLVEVQQPTDPSDFYGFAWMTRYLYDLTQSGTVTVGSSPPYRAYGGLFKTQELLPSSPTPSWAETGSSGNTGATWQDTAGTAYDGLDRASIKYRNSSIGLMPVTNTYDGVGAAGLLSQTCNANAECGTLSYDERGLKVQAQFNVASSTTQTFKYDEDGRLATAQNGAGSVADTYDSDGRKSVRTQNVASNSSATLTYGYYADGLRAGISISGLASMPNVLGYSYRPDNTMRRLTLAGSAFFAFTYTGGRRLTSRSDSTGQGPYAVSYNAFGLPASESMPVWQQTSMTYSAEGDQLGGSVNQLLSGGWFPAHQFVGTYSTRGEVVQDLYGDGLVNMANGARISEGRSTGSPPTFPATGAYTFDAKQSFPVAASTANTCSLLSSHCQDNGNGIFRNSTSTQYQYDSVGRQIGQVNVDSNTATSWQNSRKTYDAEDHLLSDTHSDEEQDAFSLGYVWGPLNHPFKVGSTSYAVWGPPTTDFQYDALYWDDDKLLFTVNSAGAIDDVKIGDLADYLPGVSNSLTVWDRTRDGQVQACHTGSGAGLAHPNSFLRVVLSCSAPTTFTSPQLPGGSRQAPTTVGRGALLTIPKGDGISDGFSAIQGVRTFDTQAGVWNSPDAYRGHVHDPMSQKPYIWNRNNPYKFSDPSGYAASASAVGTDVTIDIQVTFYSEVDDEVKARIIQDIEKVWNGQHGEYNVTVHVSEHKGEPDVFTNTIHLNSLDPNKEGRAGVVAWRDMYASRFEDAFGFAHEAGHLMSLQDAYSDEGGPFKGFEHNLMGAAEQFQISGDQIRQILDGNGYGFYNSAP
jgi:YD repeat-containing protein